MENRMHPHAFYKPCLGIVAVVPANRNSTRKLLAYNNIHLKLNGTNILYPGKLSQPDYHTKPAFFSRQCLYH